MFVFNEAHVGAFVLAPSMWITIRLFLCRQRSTVVSLVRGMSLFLAAENDQALGLLGFNYTINISVTLNLCICVYRMLCHRVLRLF